MRLENLEGIKQGFTSLRESVADGWQRKRANPPPAPSHGSGRAGRQAKVPAKAEVDERLYLPSHGWSMLGGDMFEDGRRRVVRLEVPGTDKDEFDIEVLDGALVVSGEMALRARALRRSLSDAAMRLRRFSPRPAYQSMGGSPGCKISWSRRCWWLGSIAGMPAMQLGEPGRWHRPMLPCGRTSL